MNDWKEVSWIEAANACAAGTHDTQRLGIKTDVWIEAMLFDPSDYCRYRIREKVRTITVTIPLPCDVQRTGMFSAQLVYSLGTNYEDIAIATIRAAIEGANDGR